MSTETTLTHPASQLNNQTSSRNVSFSSMLKYAPRQSEHNAIVIKQLENVSVPFTDYLLAMKAITDLNNITDAHPGGQGRVVIYLKNREIADKIAEKHTKINVRGYQVSLSKLITPSAQVVITAPTVVPNELIHDELCKYNLKLTSEVTHIMFTALKETMHICSGKRQVMVNRDTLHNMPDSFSFRFDGKDMTIYMTTELSRCKVCHKFGHAKEKCPRAAKQQNGISSLRKNISSENSGDDTSGRPALTLPFVARGNNPFTSPEKPLSGKEEAPSEQSSAENQSSPSTNKPEVQFLIKNASDEKTREETEGSKVTDSPSSTIPSNNGNITSQKDSQDVPLPEDDQEDMDVSISPSNNSEIQRNKSSTLTTNQVRFIEDVKNSYLPNESFPIELDKFVDFLIKVKPDDKALSIAKAYTADINGLKRMIADTRLRISNNWKGKLTKLSKALSPTAQANSQVLPLPPGLVTEESLTKTGSVTTTPVETEKSV